MKEEKKKAKDVLKEQKKETLFNRMPQEFRDLIQNYAYGKYAGGEPGIFINYVYEHREDYKDPNSGISVEGTLLMVQELFENPVGSPLNLSDYLDHEFRKYADKIGKILDEVKSILENLKKEGKLPNHRCGEFDEDEDNLATLTQNMHLYFYYYYRYMQWKDAQMHELDEIIESTISNMKWVLHFDDSVTRHLLSRDFGFDELEMDFFRGAKPFTEPLFALLSDPYEENCVEAYERYYSALEEMATTVKATESYKELLVDAQVQLANLYMNQKERINDSIELLENDLADLVDKRRAISKKLKRIENKKTTREMFIDGFNLPF